MLWKKMRGVKVPEEVQGLIRFTCLCYNDMPKEIKTKIDNGIDSAGGEYSEALREVLTSKRGIRYISQKYFISESSLYRMRKKFYEEW